MNLVMGSEPEAGAGTLLVWAFCLMKLITETSGREKVWDVCAPKFGFCIHQVSSVVETFS